MGEESSGATGVIVLSVLGRPAAKTPTVTQTVYPQG